MDMRIFGYAYFLVLPMISPPDFFKCMADETRTRATLLIASHGELCVCELMCAMDDSQPKISRHLAQLRSSGLLLDRRQGQWVYYRLNPNLPSWVSEVLQVTLRENEEWLKVNSARLQNMDGRPVRETACC
jgi:ArsR family transcriptional regulator